MVVVGTESYILIHLFVQDKTFGLKNKKGAKQQRFIQQVEKQVKTGGVPPRKVGEEPKKDKDAKLKEQKEMALLFRPVQKVEKGKHIYYIFKFKFVLKNCCTVGPTYLCFSHL